MQLFFSHRRLALPLILTVFFLLFSATLGFAQEDEDEDDTQTQAIAIFNQGQEAHEKGDLNNAVKLYDEAIKIVPEFPEAEYQKANAFLQLGKTIEAEKALRRALEIRGDWSLAMAALGGLLVEKNQFTEAERLLTEAVKADEQNFPAFAALTDLRLKSKASPEALQELLEKIRALTEKANPPASIWAARAALERNAGNIFAAKSSAKNALSIAPKNSAALSEQIEVALLEGDTSRALEAAKTLVQVSPDSINGKLLLIRAYSAGGNTAEAMKILNSLDQTNAYVVEFKKTLAVSGSSDIGSLEKAIVEDPKNIAVLERLCNLTRVSAPEKSLNYCRRASELEPNNLNHAVGYGAALVQAKRFKEAVNLLTRLKQIAPDNNTARANLAISLYQLKRYDEAKSEYLWLAEKQPGTPIVYYFLAIQHDQLGEYADAMANYQKFLRLANPKVNELEIEKVNLRLPGLQKLINKGVKKK